MKFGKRNKNRDWHWFVGNIEAQGERKAFYATQQGDPETLIREGLKSGVVFHVTAWGAVQDENEKTETVEINGVAVT